MATRIIGRRLLRVAVKLGIAYAVFVAFLVIFEARMVFVAHYDGPSTPEAAGLAHYHLKQLQQAGLPTINYWENNAAADAPTVLYFHGNAFGLYFRNHQETLAYLDQKKLHVIAMEYPGFAGAAGSPSEPVILNQAAALYEHVTATDKPHPIIWGYSLGSGVAVKLAACHAPAGLILEAPFTAVVDRAHELFPIIPVYQLMHNQFRSRDYIGAIHAPLFIMHGTADLIIPIHHGRDLFALANEPKQFHSYEGFGHMNLIQSNAYADAVEFIRQHGHD